MKGSLKLGRMLTVGRKTTTPVPITTSVRKLKIPRRQDMLIDGMTAEDTKGTINAEWVDYKPYKDTSEVAERVILYVHGGAYVIGSRRMYRMMTWRLSKHANARVLAVDYRLAPEATFPLPLHDVISAYAYLIDPPAGSGLPKYKPEQISFVGDSAGGGLLTGTMLYLRDSGCLPLPGAASCFSPYYDLTHAFPSWYLNASIDFVPDYADDPKLLHKNRSQGYLDSNEDILNPYACPTMSVESSTQIPPMLIQVGDADRLRDDAIVFSESSFPNSPIRVEVYQHMPHVFQFFAPVYSFSEHALMRIGQFVNEQTGKQVLNRPEVNHELLFIEYTPGFPIHTVPDAMGIVDDGVRLLVQKGVWTEDMKDTSLLVTKAGANIVRKQAGSTSTAIAAKTDVFQKLSVDSQQHSDATLV